MCKEPRIVRHENDGSTADGLTGSSERRRLCTSRLASSTKLRSRSAWQAVQTGCSFSYAVSSGLRREEEGK